MTRGEPVRLLVVEDSVDDFDLLVRALRREGVPVEASRVETREALEAALDLRWDVVIADYRIPGYSGMAALDAVRARDPDLPFIFVSGTIGEDLAVAAMRAGAQDYVIKGNLRRLAPAIERELRDAELRRARRRAEEAVRESEGRLRRIVESDMIGILFWNRDGKITDANDCLLRMLGYTRDDLRSGRIDWRLMTPPEYAPLDERALAELAERGVSSPFEKEYLRKDGSRVPVILGTAAFEQAPESGVAFVLDVSDRRRAEAEARAAASTLRAVVDASPLPVISLDLAGRVRLWNAAAELTFGWTAAEVVGRENPIVPPGDREACERARDLVVTEGKPVVGMTGGRLRRDGTTLDARISIGPTTGPDGRPDGTVLVVEDVTESRRLEAQLLHAQKLEAVGRLAGGVAHDFNNLLTVILGVSDLLLEEESSPEVRAGIDEVRDAAERAVVLTRQLLAFSRREVVEPRVVELAEVVTGVERMVRRLAGEDVELTLTFEPGPLPVRCDPGHLQQVLLNLVVNARDAMPGGGRLLVAASGNTVAGERAAALDVPPGDYAVLTVRDTGVGIPPEHRGQLFEPFFTTKPAGAGTGLGLATCHMIARQAGGAIEVESRPGGGSAFRVLLPLAEGTPVATDPRASAVPRGTETILLVEDEPRVRAVASRMLTALGYTVLEAENGVAALDLLTREGDRVALLLTDVVLPGLGGRELAERARAQRPGLRVLYASGYAEDVILRHRVSIRDVALVTKPFTAATLARKVR
jgi:two-component system, cell cycle sensor histidine kinase and response regulator CckA